MATTHLKAEECKETQPGEGGPQSFCIRVPELCILKYRFLGLRGCGIRIFGAFYIFNNLPKNFFFFSDQRRLKQLLFWESDPTISTWGKKEVTLIS